MPDAAASDRRLSSRWAEPIGTVLMYINLGKDHSSLAKAEGVGGRWVLVHEDKVTGSRQRSDHGGVYPLRSNLVCTSTCLGDAFRQ